MIALELTQAELKKILTYNPLTGRFTWKKISGNIKKDGSAGSKACYGYMQIKINRNVYKMHRLAWLYMTGKWPEGEIDHINQIKDDNRWLNLRDISNSENKKNKPIYKNNKSGIPGVLWHKRNEKWMAYIKVNSKRIHLGYFSDKFEAVCARLSANNKHGFHANHGMN